METKKLVIPIILVSLLVMGFYSSYYPQMAYAQTFQVISGFAQPIKGISYQSTTDSFWIITEGSGKTLLYQVDRSTKSVIGTFNQTANFDSLALAQAQDIWCGQTDCFVTTGGGGGNGGIAKISTVDISPNIFKGQNVTATVFGAVVAPWYHLTGRDEVSGGFGSITIWVDTCTEAAATCDGTIRVVDGISMQIVSTATAYGVTNNAAYHVHDFQWSGISGIDDNDLAVVTGDTAASSAQAELRIYDLTQSPPVQHCAIDTPGQLQPYGIATNYVSAGSVNNKVYVSTDAGNVYVYNDDCTLLQSVNSTDTGLSNDIRYIEYSSGRIFMQESGGNAKLSQLLVNSTGHIITTGDPSIYFPLPSVSQDIFESDGYTLSHGVGDMFLMGGNGQLWFPYTGSEKEVGILTYDTTVDGGGEVGGTDCDDPANEFLLICRLGADGETVGVGGLVADGIITLGCNVIFVDCSDDTNPATNGLGLLIFIASIFVVVGMFYYSIGKEAFHMPIFIYIIIILALSAFFTITGIIDPVFLVLSIVAIIALAVPKIISTIRGNTFGGGSTE
jgi:hypothetical protein